MDPAMTSATRPGRADRPDGIAQASAHDATLPPAGGGKLRIYLGIAPGVGKTYAVLRDAGFGDAEGEVTGPDLGQLAC
jgi:K+-sensing histidine kinase KdpD